MYLKIPIDSPRAPPRASRRKGSPSRASRFRSRPVHRVGERGSGVRRLARARTPRAAPAPGAPALETPRAASSARRPRPQSRERRRGSPRRRRRDAATRTPPPSRRRRRGARRATRRTRAAKIFLNSREANAARARFARRATDVATSSTPRKPSVASSASSAKSALEKRAPSCRLFNLLAASAEATAESGASSASPMSESSEPPPRALDASSFPLGDRSFDPKSMRQMMSCEPSGMRSLETSTVSATASAKERCRRCRG